MKRRRAPVDGQRLAGDLASLRSLARGDLRERWRELYGTAAPTHLGRDFLMRAVAHRLQEQALGRQSAATRRVLVQVAEDAAAGRPVKVVPTRQIMPGTRLLREWHGVTHEVIVLDDGVMFRGKRYRSLSEVARVITGSRWSGPVFFGLRAAAKSIVS